MTTLTEQAYDITPSAIVDITDKAPPEGQDHHHVCIKWAGGEVWLDMADFQDHFSIDVRQMRAPRWSDGDVPQIQPQMKGQGVFTIVNGSRQSFGDARTKIDGKPARMVEPPLVDKHGTPVTGHRWNGGYVITLLTDKHGVEAAVAPANSRGNG